MKIKETDNIECIGQTIWTIVDAMEEDKDMALEFLANNGITVIKSEKYYPIQSFLNAFNEIVAEIGPKMLFKIGKALPKNAIFPPDVDDIHKVMSTLNIAYHMNHKKDGQTMFDPTTGVMLNGIGSYLYTITSKNSGTMVCDNPYPSEFDRGIIMALARKFEPLAEVILDIPKNEKDVRKYLVSW